jgi:PAS domain S-box-containing protein
MTTVDGHGCEVSLEASMRSFPELLLQVGESLHATLVVDDQGRIARIDSTLAVAAGWGDGVPPEGRPLEEVLLLFPWLVDALRTALTRTETVSEGGEQDRWMRALVLPAPIGMGFLDRDLRFIQVNDALAALHGKTREEELGRALREVAPRVAANVEPLMHQVLETGKPRIGLDMALEVPATPGQLRHWRVSYYPVRTTSGRIVGLGAVVVELTAERRAQLERERLLHEAREAIQIRDDFLCVASHELKTPLTPLKLHLQRLKLKCASGQPLPPQYAEKALAQVDRLSGLISDMLDSSQIEAGQLKLMCEPLPLQEVIREALEDFRPACLQHPLEYEECAEELVVLGDRGRLAQVLTNLLENARKYSPLRGPIRVTLTRSGAEALVSVSDRGIGIPADQQAHLFERFFRARNAPVSGFGGLGLGLYICRYLVELHGGRIWAESQDGQGTTFRFTLPVEPAPPLRGRA